MINIPLLILALLSAISIGICMSRHGEEYKDKYNVWTKLLAWIIQWILIIWGLYW
jgi:hypothetical protein